MLQVRKYYCVNVPYGLDTLTFKLTNLTAQLHVYIGSPDMDTLVHGGFLAWSSVKQDPGDKTVVVSSAMFPSLAFVRPGAYYIEVSAANWQDSSPFTLTASSH